MKQDYIKKLIRILEGSEIDSIQLSSFWGMNKIKLIKSSQKAVFSEGPRTLEVTSDTETLKTSIPSKSKDSIENSDMTIPDQENLNTDPKSSSSLHDIKAPLVGTIYFSPKPGEPSFIKVGDKIELGQIICIIEAMKIFNEIESEVSGTIRKILIDDSHPVEYGQAIISVEIND